MEQLEQLAAVWTQSSIVAVAGVAIAVAFVLVALVIAVGTLRRP